MEFVVEEGKHLNEECSTLILPALSIGNVGQLAVDLLISSMRAERIGYLDDPNVLPCVGNDAYSPTPQGHLALPLEAYGSSSNTLTLVQQRSPVVKGMMVEFAKNVADFAAASGKKHIVVLSSLDFGRWQTIDMSSGLQIYYLSSASMDGTDDDCERLGWKKLQEYNPEQRLWKYLSTLAEGNAELDDNMPFEDELGEDDYYPSLPFAALFSCFKQLKVVMDSIIWAFRHTERNIAETGLNLLLEMMKNFQTSEFCNQFYRTYFVTIEQEIFAVLTDTFHKPGFKLHVLVLQHLFCLVESGSLTEPLWDVTTVPYPYPNNAMFVREYTIKLLGTSFPNMTTTEVTQFVSGLFESRNDLSTFKNHIRDFLVQSKEFSAQDNKDLYAEEAAAQRERERQRMLTIPGLIAPNEIQDEMVDS